MIRPVMLSLALLAPVAALAWSQSPSTQPSRPASGQEAAPPEEATPLPSVELPAELARVLTDYEAAWGRKDAAGLAQLFTEDGMVLPSGKLPSRGRAAIEKAYAGQGGPLALRAFAWATSGDVGYILGGYAGGKGEPDIGKYTLTLRRVSGRWLIVSDMDNTNRRPR